MKRIKDKHRKRYLVWRNKNCSWHHIEISFGKRRSEIKQYFPVMNTSHNTKFGLLFGFGLKYFEASYHYKKFNSKINRLLKNLHILN